MSSNNQFVRADSSNLPKVDVFMLIQYMKTSDKYNDAELRGVKVLMSSRDSYMDNAIGYVELKKKISLCTLKARVVPEHRVANKPYAVSAIIDEKDDKIIEATCEDCPASAGGCKHSLVFLFWLQKKSEEPATTSVQCYWNKPALGNLKHDYVLAEDVFPCAKKMKRLPRDENFLKKFIEECEKHPDSNKSLISKHFSSQQTFKSYYIFNLLLNYESQYKNTDYHNFKNYCNGVLTDDVKKIIETATLTQVETVKWHNIRQGRITASKLYEICHCKTAEGSLVHEILGGYKLIETKAMKRGKQLESVIIKKLENSFKTPINKSGFFVCDSIFGASPDGIFENKKYIVEIKCPSKKATVKNYITKNKTISEKCMAQVQMQMHCTNIKKCLFCVAHVEFETNGNITVLFVDYDEDYICSLLNKAEEFYLQNIFPKIVKSVLS